MPEHLEIHTIQNNAYQIKSIIQKLKNSNDTTLITNCITGLKVGNKKLCTIFDKALYSEENNILVLFVEYCSITPDEIKDLLDSNKIKYNEITFFKYSHFRPRKNKKELFFSTDIKSFNKCIKDSTNKGLKSCRYYPNMIGVLRLKYFIDKKKSEQFDVYSIKGLVELNDKLVLLVNNNKDYNMTRKKVLSELHRMNITTNIDDSMELPEEVQRIKQKKKGDASVRL